MNNELRMECLRAKKVFVDKLSEAVSGQHGAGSIDQVRYEAFEHDEYGIQEYMVITFNGGAISVRSVNGNSHSAILRDLGEMCDGGYYSEVKTYRELTENSSWKKIL